MDILTAGFEKGIERTYGARDEIALERDKARITLRDDVVKLAMDIAGKVVHEELNAEKHKKLVDTFLKEVESAR